MGSKSVPIQQLQCAVSSSYDTESEMWAGVGWLVQFRVHEFLVHFITILSKIYFRLIKAAKKYCKYNFVC